MGLTGLKEYDNSLCCVKEWISEARDVLYLSTDEDAYAVLKAVLHSLRDVLPAEHAVKLGARLPLLLAGTYYENWTGETGSAKIENEADFYNLVLQNLRGREDYNPMFITKGIFRVIAAKLTAEEINSIAGNFPQTLCNLFHEDAQIS